MKKKPTYRKWKDLYPSNHLTTKEYNGVKYIEGYYLDTDGHAVRVYAEQGRGDRPASLNMNMSYNGYCYCMIDSRELTSHRGYALIAAKFIRDVISGKIEPLLSKKRC